ncbi:MAG: thioredoxin [Myxococcales bacterium]|nr:thioredoxin [Myxococcales bacterium]MCB9669955.1 thioredoxin [Alphaproteobacteria bacterium]
MSANVTDVTDATFDTQVLKSDVPVLVDFWAEWCGPCKALAPHVHAVADEHAGKLKVVKLDIQTNQRSAMGNRVSSIPTLIVFKGGREVARQTGAAGGLQAIRRLVSSHV